MQEPTTTAPEETYQGVMMSAACIRAICDDMADDCDGASVSPLGLNIFQLRMIADRLDTIAVELM